MEPRTFADRMIEPHAGTLHTVAGQTSDTNAKRILLTIAGQESNWTHRFQVVAGVAGSPGPARGFWQFEEGGGVKGVLGYKSGGVADKAAALCADQFVQPNQKAVHRSIEGNDVLAYGFARLLLRTDPAAIPTGENDAWLCYLRLWRPGKPYPDKWPMYWRKALDIYPL